MNNNKLYSSTLCVEAITCRNRSSRSYSGTVPSKTFRVEAIPFEVVPRRSYSCRCYSVSMLFLSMPFRVDATPVEVIPCLNYGCRNYSCRSYSVSKIFHVEDKTVELVPCRSYSESKQKK